MRPWILSVADRSGDLRSLCRIESEHAWTRRMYAEFLSGSALNLALKSYVEGTAPAAALAKRTDEFTTMQAGQEGAVFLQGLRRSGRELVAGLVVA